MKNWNVDHSFQWLKILTVFVRSGQIRRHDVIHASLFRVGDYDQYLEKLTLYELVIVRRNVGKKRVTLYDILRYGERQE